MKLMILYLTTTLLISVVAFFVGLAMNLLNRVRQRESSAGATIMSLSLSIGFFAAIILRIYHIVLYTDKKFILDQITNDLMLLLVILMITLITISTVKKWYS